MPRTIEMIDPKTGAVYPIPLMSVAAKLASGWQAVCPEALDALVALHPRGKDGIDGHPLETHYVERDRAAKLIAEGWTPA